MRIGVYGGTFDPPHVGHLIVASDVCDAMRLDRLLLVPAAEPPHKRGSVHASAELRLEMVRAAVADDPRLEVDDIELRREGASYSVDTLREIRERAPGCELFFVVGFDQLREFASWRSPDEVARLAHLVAVAREGEQIDASFPFPATRVEVTRIDLSATELRARIAAGRPVRYLLPDAVRAIVEREGLYL